MPPIVFLSLAIVLTVASQVLQKQVAMVPQNQRGDSAILFFSKQPRFWLALSLLGLALLCWLLVLHTMEVSKAYTLLSLNYVLMLVASRVFFHEDIPLTRWLGVLVIVGGIVCISWS